MRINKRVSICIIIISLLLVTACAGNDIVPEVAREQIPEATPTPEQTPEPTPEPPPEPTPESTPEQTPEPTPEQRIGGFAFPFSFSTEDLQGNTVTEETLGEKELFVAYLWAVW